MILSPSIPSNVDDITIDAIGNCRLWWIAPNRQDVICWTCIGIARTTVWAVSHAWTHFDHCIVIVGTCSRAMIFTRVAFLQASNINMVNIGLARLKVGVFVGMGACTL